MSRPTVTEVDRRLRSADAAGIRAVDLACETEIGSPALLVPPDEHVRLAFTHLPVHEHLRLFVARREGRITGYAWCSWEDVASNRNVAGLSVRVAPGADRHEPARDLLGRAVEAATAFGCDLALVEAPAAGPEADFLTSAGFEAKLRSPRNVVRTNALRRDLLDRWIAGAEESAAGYELRRWDGACPDEWIDGFVDLWHVMNTAPIDDLDWEPEVMTRERFRGEEAAWTARGITPWTVVAVEKATGTFAGFTTLFLDRYWPAVVEQGDTGVRTGHRRRGLGRWLKAVNALRLLDERPATEVVVTENAGSNAAMLAVNHALGFAAVDERAEWQADVADLG